jgi:histidinol-phosphate/aromatic aminotransferase/cobyric acid decarboxylase-like protein/predicted GNAT family N-acyltransferase
MHATAYTSLQKVPVVGRISLRLATDTDRNAIYRMRHEVYASELGQHGENVEGALTDELDRHNVYIVAANGADVLGFIGITPPESPSFSIDKYVPRADVPIEFDRELFEVRILTVQSQERGKLLSLLLCYGALRWIEEQGGTRVIAMGRKEVMPYYQRIGFQPCGIQFDSGRVTFELMTSRIADHRKLAGENEFLHDALESSVEWNLPFEIWTDQPCVHGGSFFDAIGVEFDNLSRRHDIINADVLDAWFPPTPNAIRKIESELPWLMRTSPPTESEGLVRTIARVRNLDADCILPGAGSSDLMYRYFIQGRSEVSRALVPDPTYGEYEHLLSKVIGCDVDRYSLSRDNGYQLDPRALAEHIQRGVYDLVVLVNPNSPTGRHVQSAELAAVIESSPESTLFWIDETYSEYAGAGESLESLAMQRSNLVISKSMSKVYALSGLRVAYLVTSQRTVRKLREVTPPWVVSLPGQVAGIAALLDPDYYAARYMETHENRRVFVEELARIEGLEIVPSVTNFVLFHLPDSGPDAAQFASECRNHGLYLRDVSAMGPSVGSRAVRVALKDAETNRKILSIIRRVLQVVCEPE